MLRLRPQPLRLLLGLLTHPLSFAFALRAESLNLLLGLLVESPDLLLRLLAELLPLLLGVAEDLSCGGLGRLDDRLNLAARSSRKRAAATAGCTGKLGDLRGDRAQVRVDGLGLVPPTTDGKVFLLDALSIK